MRAADSYFIVWKGRRDGPFSPDQLAALLQRGEIGLLHRVETGAGPVPLRQLLLDSDPVRWAGLVANSSGATVIPFDSAIPSPFPAPPPNPAPPPPATTPAPISTPPATPAAPAGYSTELPETPPIAPVNHALLPLVPKLPDLRSLFHSGEPNAAFKAYAFCGLCFLFPPLAWWIHRRLVPQFAAQGHSQIAQRIQALSLGQAAGGAAFWLLLILLWWLW